MSDAWMQPTVEYAFAARKLVPEGTFYQISVYDDAAQIAEEGFDIAVSTEVIEHLYSPGALVELAWRKLRRGGHLVVSTPYHGYIKNLALSVLNRWDSHHGALRDGGHIKFWSKKTLGALVRAHGFEVVRFKGVGRKPLLYRSMILVCRKVARSG